MMDEEIRQAVNEVREMKQMCGNINMKLTNIVTQRGQDWKKKLETEYQRGLSEGNDIGYKDGVKDGQNEAWEAAKKISLMSPDEIEKVFPGAAKYNRYNLGYSGVEVIEKLKAYEQKRADKIGVGDVVKTYNGITFVVTRVTIDGTVIGFAGDGRTCGFARSEVTKTGEHYNINEILGGLCDD